MLELEGKGVWEGLLTFSGTLFDFEGPLIKMVCVIHVMGVAL
jgi:hypothetical protein